MKNNIIGKLLFLIERYIVKLSIAKNIIFFIFVISNLDFAYIIPPKDKHPYASDQPISIAKKFEIPGYKNAGDITFLPGGNTFYFVAGGDTTEEIYYSCFKNAKTCSDSAGWNTPKLLEPTGKGRWETPCISPDGKKFFLTCLAKGHEGIYVMDKTETGWSKPRDLGKIINSLGSSVGPSCAANGNLYFMATSNAKLQIYCSKYINSKYTEPELLSYTINKYNVIDPFIAPDESFILFSVFEQPYSYRLHVSFNRNGSWTSPIDLGASINRKDYQSRASISPDGNYLFFVSGSHTDWKMSQYQVDIKPILDSLRNISCNIQFSK